MIGLDMRAYVELVGNKGVLILIIVSAWIEDLLLSWIESTSIFHANE